MTPTNVGGGIAEMMDRMLFDPATLVGIFILALVVASAGAIAGFLTRKLLVIFGAILLFALVVQFHSYLPLPPAANAWFAEIEARYSPF